MNLKLWNDVREVPNSAQKQIAGGRLKGMTDINPMWRFKALTEQFGPCGFGWKYEVTDKRLEHGANDEIAAFVDINLHIKTDNEWSAPIPGTGGSAFVSKEKSGLYVSDECFKMALTDAISVACKALGFGADVYWDKDKTKYNNHAKPAETITKDQLNKISTIMQEKGISKSQARTLANGIDKSKELTKFTSQQGEQLIQVLQKVEATNGKASA